MRWGLIPSWHRGDPKEFTYNMSNARSDTLLDKRSFKSPLEKGNRCVVLAEGYVTRSLRSGLFIVITNLFFMLLCYKCESD